MSNKFLHSDEWHLYSDQISFIGPLLSTSWRTHFGGSSLFRRYQFIKLLFEVSLSQFLSPSCLLLLPPHFQGWCLLSCLVHLLMHFPEKERQKSVLIQEMLHGMGLDLGGTMLSTIQWCVIQDMVWNYMQTCFSYRYIFFFFSTSNWLKDFHFSHFFFFKEMFTWAKGNTKDKAV